MALTVICLSPPDAKARHVKKGNRRMCLSFMRYSNTVLANISLLLLFSVSTTNFGYSQQYTEVQVKAAYVNKFLSNFKWENDAYLQQYVIGFIGDEPEMYNELQNLANTKKANSRQIKVIRITDWDTDEKIHILYVAASENRDVKNISLAFNGKNTLLITNDCPDKTAIMINFELKENGTVRFEINKPNIIYEKLVIASDIVLKGGTELDVAELYNEMETELQNFKNTSQQQQNILKVLNNKIENQNQLISERENQLSNIQNKYLGVSDSLMLRSQALNLKEQALYDKEQELLSLNVKIADYNGHLKQQEEKIIERNMEIENKEEKIQSQNQLMAEQIKQIEQHKAKEKQQGVTIQKQYYINILIAIVLLFVLIILIQYFRSLKKQKQTNKLISEQNSKLLITTTELKKAKDAAETANRAKTDFLSNMSHELRTPLNAILGYSQMLQRDKNMTSKQVKNLSTVYSSGSHLLSLINDILDFGKIEAGKIEIFKKDFNLNNLLRTVYNISLVKAEEKEIYLRFESFSEIPAYVNGDERRIKQVLINLLSNAIKYTHHGGVIFRTGYIYADINVFRAEIEDTGEGIEANKLMEIFEAFTQVSTRKNYIEGTGLGLPITKQLVELMDGTISVTSQPDKGSIFSIEIPLPAIAETFSLAAIDVQIIGYSGATKSVLIVDDNPANLSVLADLMEITGFDVRTAQSGKEALEKLHHMQPDLILLDFVMPEMDGLDLVTAIREIKLGPQSKIIGISATITGQKRQKDFLSRCDDFIQKPVDNNQLFDSIKRLLQIEWLKEKINTPQRKEFVEDSEKELILPPNDITMAIVEYAKMGAFTQIEQVINQLKEDGKYSVFCEKISYYNDNFDDDRIMQTINQKK